MDKLISQDGDVAKEDEDLVFDPFNPNNIEITLEQVNSILKSYGLPSKVHNINLYKRAFIHKSYVKRPHLENVENGVIIVDKPHDCMALKSKSNERLEFLGDGVLELVTKYYLYRRFPKENEGFMTEKKIALVKNESIGKMAYDMGLHKYYIISKHAEEKNTRTNLKKLGCLFEAFIGALFLDYNKIEVMDDEAWFKNVFVTGPGFQMAQKFIENIFELSEPSNTIAMTMDEYIQTVIEWHKSLLFVNPTIEERDMSNDKLTIALPPGIQNLGATCYLNTQLQCLAQIPVFLAGIFSWRPVNATHQMNGVMTKLQKLLAQMLVGGNAKYTSLDFSNALGIQHNEQQDPNEFARLLFDRFRETHVREGGGVITLVV